MKILFICTGNTCRSQMAEGLFRKLVKDEGLEEKFMCHSAGLSSVNGEAVSENAIFVLKQKGIDISDHVSRRFNPKEIPMWDVYFTMTQTHAYILEKAGIPNDKIYAPRENILDPFEKDLDTYKKCRDDIEMALREFLDRLKKYL